MFSSAHSSQVLDFNPRFSKRLLWNSPLMNLEKKRSRRFVYGDCGRLRLARALTWRLHYEKRKHLVGAAGATVDPRRLIKGTQGQYVPWASQDLEGLVTRLPDIHEGAGKWIKVFEEETMGKLLAAGDIKALLAKTIGGAKMEEILQASDLERAVNSHYIDGTIFDAFRPAVWQTLRAEYPIRLDPKSLKGEQLGETENPTAYVQRQLKRWKQETEGNPERDPLMATLFRNAVIDAMPLAVKSRLEDVWSNTENEQKLKNQEKELQRKLTQLQLEKLTRKNKKKIQAPVKKEESEQMTVMAPVNAPPPAIQSSPPAAVPPNPHQIPVPVINIYTQQPESTGWKRKPAQGGQRGRGRPYTGPPGVCWGCGQPGHNKNDCPTNPWQQPPRGGRGEIWQQPYQGPSQGPVNPWRDIRGAQRIL
ncbi:Retrovirus-related Pol polyprotein from transposon TNT 1-94 [Labeo rohita]|uniref:Retrovirus-related Pol polyprotein from transposon TNT 1-94 n=1 Tax=Labeo rohita TaxID=84645 RepID=A0ABQ8KZG0_LABRO|nr:Retrovirus-related Pol polyprotein from transposon TNT 1-94 [Labeo rohita]